MNEDFNLLLFGSGLERIVSDMTWLEASSVTAIAIVT